MVAFGKCLGAGLLLCALSLSHASAAPAAKPDTPPRVTSGCQVPEDVAWNKPVGISTDIVPKRSPAQGEIRIVVLGSSSTAGAGASDPAHSYVAQLNLALTARDITRPVRIINAGVNGQTAPDMLRRLRKDVLDLHPALVIWQTGVNDAIRGIGPDAFKESLHRGVTQLKAAGIPVVLIDQQDFPNAGKIRDFASYVATIADVARQENLRLLQRYRVMRYLSGRRPGGLPSLLAGDHFHMNDFAHTCIGTILADGIIRLLR